MPYLPEQDPKPARQLTEEEQKIQAEIDDLAICAYGLMMAVVANKGVQGKLWFNRKKSDRYAYPIKFRNGTPYRFVDAWVERVYNDHDEAVLKTQAYNKINDVETQRGPVVNRAVTFNGELSLESYQKPGYTYQEQLEHLMLINDTLDAIRIEQNIPHPFGESQASDASARPSPAVGM